jgi:hypothetical protein
MELLADYMQVSIFNTLGEKIISTSFKNNIDVSEFPTGMYYIEIIGNKSSLRSKFLKN